MQQRSSSETSAPRPAWPWARLAAIAVLLLVAMALGRAAGGQVPRFAAWVDGLGIWGPLAFISGYAAATVAFVPGSLLTLSAGAIFGLGRGVAYVFVGASLGATLAFLVSRTLLRGAMERRFATDPRFAAIDRAVAAEGLKIVALLRLSPVFPFNALNYALGLTRVSLRDYVIACLGMLPGTLLYVYYGKVAGDLAALAGGVAPDRDAAYWAVLVVGLAATLTVTALVTRTARRALRGVADV